MINLYISFDHIASYSCPSNNITIELLLTKKSINGSYIDFNQSTELYSVHSLATFSDKNRGFDFLINYQNRSEELQFDIQKHTTLNLKPIFLHIRVNEILIQKSHRI